MTIYNLKVHAYLDTIGEEKYFRGVASCIIYDEYQLNVRLDNFSGQTIKDLKNSLRYKLMPLAEKSYYSDEKLYKASKWLEKVVNKAEVKIVSEKQFWNLKENKPLLNKEPFFEENDSEVHGY